MVKIEQLVIVFLSLLLYACRPADKAPIKSEKVDSSAPKLTFEKDTLEFGDIKKGKSVLMKYVFHNTGKKPLILFDVRTSCGCTAANWPTKPVNVGASDTLTVKFDSSNKNGDQQKLVTVFSNSSERVKMLVFKGNVKE